MANEANEIQLSVVPATQRSIALDTDTVEMHSLLALSGANNVIVLAADQAAAAFGGIAATEKVASDGSTRIGAHMHGVWDLNCVGDAEITAGDMVELSGANGIRLADASSGSISGGAIVGYAQEDVAAGTAQRVAVALIGGY